MYTEEQRNALCCDLVHDVASSFGGVRLKVTGSSMLPVVLPGDEIDIEKITYAELRSGDIVLYRHNNGLTAHRIVMIAQTHLVTQGDSLPDLDPMVEPCDVVGRVVRVLRNGVAVASEPYASTRLLSSLLQRSDLFRRLAQYVIRHFWRFLHRFLSRSGDMHLI